MTINRKYHPSLSQEFERLDGLVERVTFHNADSGFCVLRLHVKGERDLVTLVGSAPAVTPGDYASASGTWTPSMASRVSSWRASTTPKNQSPRTSVV
jgi:hypothetical protein